jgi:hypothetical protein
MPNTPHRLLELLSGPSSLAAQTFFSFFNYEGQILQFSLKMLVRVFHVHASRDVESHRRYFSM